ncbi:hypothetical protein [Dyadobacter sp. CY326]|uniref:PorZ beta-propeller-like domain-containing protein n=1 Tax=Dyadobacter sp. CY326 TaxID=2907300 RepID=UPI001F401002|nr:hypothetical protein [Dyadobacter sp. CY326]MCE7065324.1 hypothetical protein [Dyadobacter sp. CY326]
MKRPFLIVFFWHAIFQMAMSQNVPIGNWETHFNYLSAKHLTKVNEAIFCASHNGLFSINIANKEIKTWSKSDGLHDSGISSMAFHEQDKLLLFAYKSGNVDMVYLNAASLPEHIINWPLLTQNADLPDKKDIKRIVFQESLAYLCTSFGIVVLDTKNQQVEETYRYIGGNGAQVSVSDIAFAADSLYAITSEGMLATSMSASVNRQDFSNWKAIATPGKGVAISAVNRQLYAAYSEKGLFQKVGGNWKIIASTMSKNYAMSVWNNALTVTLDDRFIVLDEAKEVRTFTNPAFKATREVLQTNADKFWVADSRNGLLHNAETNFQSFTPEQADTTIFPKTDSSIVDLNGLSWTRLPDYLGGGILVKNAENQQRVLSTNIGSGSLPSAVINSLALSTDGYVWFASDRGVGYFVTDGILSGTRADAVLPIFGQRKLFANEKCTAIAIEPGNRKWIGTRNGLYLFNEDGTEMIEKFTAADSPLPSDSIVSLQFNAEKGILYIDTPNGMVAYRSNSSASSENFSSVTVFPNPVHPGYAGTIGIKGLMGNSTVKITELSGRLIYETRSQGGTASWNLNDYTGRRAKGGIYMVLIVSEDGSEKFAGKLAVIE